MSQKILQINMNFRGARADLEEAWLPGAEPISQVPGLRWKVWLVDEERHEAGGIYLFDSQSALQAFLNGPIAAQLSQDPTLSNISVKQFDVMERHTATTRGPIVEGVRV